MAEGPERPPADSLIALADDGTVSEAPRENGAAAQLADIDRYHVHDELARGGLGRILAADDRRLERRVAVKQLIEPGRGDGRLLREALITARLEHPGIVPIHDAGRLPDGSPFYSMKLVAGRSLRDVIRDRPSARDRLALLPTVIAVADAIAYAHSQRVIHRDLKPSNVICGAFGETVVIDWGLAKRLDRPDASESTGAGSSSADAELTAAGAVLGTPAYMPPEQARGEPVDERADVFALGGLLYHVLAGEPPYRVDARDPRPLSAVVPDAPEELAAIVAKAMAPDPAERYPDAGALADDLRRYQTGRLVAAHDYSPLALALRWLRRRRALLAALGGLALLAAGGLALWRWREAQSRVCTGAAAKLAGMWDAPARERAQAALLATGKPYAPAAWTAVDRAFTGFAAAWTAAHVDACLATRTRHEQSEELLDLRVACLDRRLGSARALARLFEQADGALAERAVAAVRELPPLEPCADLELLRAPLPPPEDPAVWARVDGARTRLADVDALLAAGRYQQGIELARPVWTEARALGYRPLEAQAGLALGRLLVEDRDVAGAESVLADAALAAEAGRDLDTAARAWLHLHLTVAAVGARPADAAIYERWAAAAIERLDHPPELSLRLLVNRAKALQIAGKFADALPLLEQAQRRAAALLPPGHRLIEEIAGYHAEALHRLGRLDEALASYRRVLEARKQTLGPQHPSVAQVDNAAANALMQMGRYDEAHQAAAEAVVIGEAALGPDHPLTARYRTTLGAVAYQQGRYDEARAYFTAALPILDKAYGPDHPEVLLVLSNLGGVASDQGRYDEALSYHDRVLASRERVQGQHPDLGYTLYNIGQAHLERRDPAAALAALARARAVFEATLGPDHPHLVMVLTAIGKAELLRGRRGEARQALEAAVALGERVEGDPYDLAGARSLLARALGADERARAIELAEAARAAFAASGEVGAKMAQQTAAWIAWARGGGGAEPPL